MLILQEFERAEVSNHQTTTRYLLQCPVSACSNYISRSGGLHGDAAEVPKLMSHCGFGLQGARAQAYVTKWDWKNVAMQYAGLIRGVAIEPITPDPFADAPAMAAAAKWNGSSVALPNGNTWNFLFLRSSPTITKGAYALYIDVDIQVRSST